MQDADNSIEVSLAGLEKADWKARLIAQADVGGMSQLLGERHFATFIDQNSTLLVSFETVQGIRALSSDSGKPSGKVCSTR